MSTIPTSTQDRAGGQRIVKIMSQFGLDKLFGGDPDDYYGWSRTVHTATDLEFRKVINDNYVGELLNPAVNFSEDGYAHGLLTRVRARTPELWAALENAVANPGTANQATRKKRQDTLTLWRDDDRVLSLVVRSLMSPRLQDRIIFDKIRDSGKGILDELDKVFEPLGKKATIRMTGQVYSMTPTPGESIIDFLCRIRRLLDQLAAAGSPITNDILHEIVPKKIQDQPGMAALANRWIHHRDDQRDISKMIYECREEIRQHPSQSFHPPQLYTEDERQSQNYPKNFRRSERYDDRSHGHSRHRKFHHENFKKKIFQGRCFNCNKTGHKASDCKQTVDRSDEREQEDSDNEYSDRRRGRKVSCRRCENRDGRRNARDKCVDEEEINEREEF